MRSRPMSFLESMTNVIGEYDVAVMTQVAVFTLFGLQPSLNQNPQIGLIFTIVSLVRR